MLLATFHGGPSGVDQVYAYHIKTKELRSTQALEQPTPATLSELRSIVVANGLLYVTSGGKSTSTLLCYRRDSAARPAETSTNDPLFTYVSTVIGPTVSKKQFTTAIAHPFGVAFATDPVCYVSNQDTNVVAKVDLSSDGQTGSLGTGCRSAFLSGLFPSPATFLDGTFVASQEGALPDVAITATSVPATDGGLGLQRATQAELAAADSAHKEKLQNSVRDVAVANGFLFVCDEVDHAVNMYSLTNGAFLGQAPLASKPTHLAIYNGGLYVSAGTTLFWGQLPTQNAAPTLTQVTLAPPSVAGKTATLGGISFDGVTSTAYIPFQVGTRKVRTGAIWTYTVNQSDPSKLPTLNDAGVFVDALPDTPEFVCYVPD